jgi:pimeloyl-ACP methyl ester carboxylesterase
MRRRILGGLLLALFAGGVGGVGWYRQVFLPARFSPADPVAFYALRSDGRVTVSREDWIVLQPADRSVNTGFIFYPGGECAPEGYAEPLRQVAESGYLVVLVPMPFSLAVLAPDRAADVVAAFPGIRHWAVGGHSEGGAAAARFVYRHPGLVEGLLLWDAYPAPTDDLSKQTLAVRQIHRLEADGLAPLAYRQSNHLLPPQTDFTPMAGASHLDYGRFIPAGRYAAVPATMPIEDQHRRIAASTVDFLSRLAVPRKFTPAP